MCHRVTCHVCHKPSYRGCGMHVEQVLAGVPHSQRCSCDHSGDRLSDRLFAWLRRR